MNKTKLAALFAGAALAALATACSDTASNANANRAAANVPSNTAVVTNTGPANTAPANTNRVRYDANISEDEYKKNEATYKDEAKKGGRTIGTGANDGWLWVKVRGALLAADDLRDSTIDVDVDNAVVTLSGTVANGNQKVRAVDVAKKVDGVKNVTNKLAVAAAGSGNANAATANANKR